MNLCGDNLIGDKVKKSAGGKYPKSRSPTSSPSTLEAVPFAAFIVGCGEEFPIADCVASRAIGHIIGGKGKALNANQNIAIFQIGQSGCRVGFNNTAFV
jgi:hypothetical protein